MNLRADPGVLDGSESGRPAPGRLVRDDRPVDGRRCPMRIGRPVARFPGGQRAARVQPVLRAPRPTRSARVAGPRRRAAAAERPAGLRRLGQETRSGAAYSQTCAPCVQVEVNSAGAARSCLNTGGRPANHASGASGDGNCIELHAPRACMTRRAIRMKSGWPCSPQIRARIARAPMSGPLLRRSPTSNTATWSRRLRPRCPPCGSSPSSRPVGPCAA